MWEALLAVAGSLLFSCASEPSTGELYFKDDAGHVHQLTVTESKQGAGDAVWQGDRIVAVIDRGFPPRVTGWSTSPVRIEGERSRCEAEPSASRRSLPGVASPTRSARSATDAWRSCG